VNDDETDFEGLAREFIVCEGELRLMGDEYERTP